MAVYSVSGITLIFRRTNTFKKVTEVKTKLKPNLNENDLGKNLKIRKRTAIFLKDLFNSDKYNTCKALEVGAGWGFLQIYVKNIKLILQLSK